MENEEIDTTIKAILGENGSCLKALLAVEKDYEHINTKLAKLDLDEKQIKNLKRTIITKYVNMVLTKMEETFK